MVALDDSDATEGLGETARDFSINLRPLAEDWSDSIERPSKDEPEDEKNAKGEKRHQRADSNQYAEGNDSGKQATDKFEKPRSNEIPDALYIGHNAGDKRSRTVLVVKGDREAADMLLHLHAKLRNETLAGIG